MMRLPKRALCEDGCGTKDVLKPFCEFVEFIKRFPKHDLADNAQYWIGEGYYAQKKYEPALTAYQHSDIQNIKINYNKLVILPIGFRNWLGWLGLYIILSIIFSLGLRKLMKVY